MASLRKESDRGRTGWRLQFRQGGKRRSLWIGTMSKRAADTIARHVEELGRAADANVAPAADAVRWAEGVDDRTHKTLNRWGLVDARVAADSQSRLCVVFFKNWREKNCDTERTKNNYKQASDWFEKKFGKQRSLSSITPADFADWHRWMVTEGLAQSTANKHAKRVRTLFKHAIRARLLHTNPGDGHKIGGESNSERDHYVSPGDAEAIIERCDTEWAVLFGLCRYAGLRCPSEVTGLQWSDIQWDEQRLRIDSRKTGLRFAPIIPPLRPLLDVAWDAAPEGAKYVISRYRDRESNLRTQLKRIVESAGLTLWPKPFVNLRGSCRTDLEERFPSHVCDAWMGHSTKIAKKHYLRVTEAHWERAVTEDQTAPIQPDGNAAPNTDTAKWAGGVRRGVIPAHSESFRAEPHTQNPSVSLAETDGHDSERQGQYPRQDSNLRPAR